MILSTEIKDGYIRKYHKKNKVWAQLAPNGQTLAEHNGKVKIKYQLAQSQEYLVPVGALRDIEEGPDPKAESAAKKPGPAKPAPPQKQAPTPAKEPLPASAIIMYTDGASSGNPGPAGIGVYLQFGGHVKEISEYIGVATNNIAELMAVKRGLEAVKNKKLPVRILTDSQYVLGLLTLNWKAQKNQELVASIKSLMTEFNDLQFIKVKGHNGEHGNEKADELAVMAVKKAGE